MNERLKTVRISLVLLMSLIILAGCIFSEAYSVPPDIVAVQETGANEPANEGEEPCDEEGEPPLSQEDATLFELNGVVMSAHIPDVSDGSPHNEILNGLNYQAETVISLAILENDRIYISGDINGVPFQVEGYFVSISQSGNTLVFNATDILGNFRFIHCAVVQNITLASHYFQVFSNNNPQYNVATLLYLATYGKSDFVVIEIFGNNFPTISAEAINALPEYHSRNLWFWQTRMLPPVAEEVEPE